MKKLNWGIIGLGRIAETFASGFSNVSNSKLLSVASRDKLKLDKFEYLYKIEKRFLFDNYEDLINCNEIDIIYIALPNTLHYLWIKKSIEKKKNVLVEKPATMNVTEAENIEKNLIDKNIFFSEAFMYRYLPQLELIIDMIKDNKIGDLISLESNFGINLLTKKKFFIFEKKKKINPLDRKFNKDLGGGCIYDLGCYPSSFSLLLNSLNKKNEFNKFSISNIKKEIGETDVEIDASANISFYTNFNAKINSSFKKNLGNQSIIEGTNGSIVLNDTWKGDKVILNINKKKYKEFDLNENKNIYSYQIEKVSESIINKSINYPGMSMEDTLQNMKIIQSWKNE